MNRTCPECAETVKAKAKVCKHCGYRFSDWEAMQQRVQQNEQKKIDIGIGFAKVGVWIFAICFFYFFKGCSQQAFITFDIGTERSNAHFFDMLEKGWWIMIVIGIPLTIFIDRRNASKSNKED